LSHAIWLGIQGSIPQTLAPPNPAIIPNQEKPCLVINFARCKGLLGKNRPFMSKLKNIIIHRDPGLEMVALA